MSRRPGRPLVVRLAVSVALVAGAVPLVATAGAEEVGLVAENVTHLANVPGGTGGHSVIEGNRLYVGAYGYGMRLFDIANPRAPKLIGEFRPGPQTDGQDPDPGVRADAVPDAAVLNGRHIVTLNGTRRTAGAQQTEFLDWTNPAKPELLFRFSNGDDGESHNGDIVDARRWWVPSGLVNFRIYDLTPLLGKKPAAPKRLVSVSPRDLWEASPHRAGRPVGGPSTSIHDIEIYPGRQVVVNGKKTRRDIALVSEGGNYLQGNNTGSLYILDITNPRAPVALLRHQRTAKDGKAIRYVHETQFLHGTDDIIVTADEDLHSGCNAGGIAVSRVSPDLTRVQELSQWFIGTGTPAPVCSVHVMSTKDRYAFFGSYNAGLQVVDLANPSKPVRAGQFIAPGANSWGALVHPKQRGYVTYVGDLGARGLDVLELQVPDRGPGAKGKGKGKSGGRSQTGTSK